MVNLLQFQSEYTQQYVMFVLNGYAPCIVCVFLKHLLGCWASEKMGKLYCNIRFEILVSAFIANCVSSKRSVAISNLSYLSLTVFSPLWTILVYHLDVVASFFNKVCTNLVFKIKAFCSDSVSKGLEKRQNENPINK